MKRKSPLEINLLLPRASEKQKEFLEAKERYVAYGGARGGGKSWAVRTKALLLALRYEGAKILILRRTLGELRENHIRPLKELTKGIASFNEQRKEFSFVNSSTIILGYLAKEKDLQRYQGQEYDFIFIDEATQMEEYVFTVLKATLRGTNGYPKRMYLTCNPGGVGHLWVKRLFVDRHFRKGENPQDYRFISAKIYDNQVLMEKDPSYLAELQSLPEDLRKAWLEGCWDIFKGQYFEEFQRELHVVEPFEIPSDYKRYMAFDYGLDMLACLWFAVDPYGRIYVYRELHESGLIVSKAARKMVEYTGNEEITTIYMPPDMGARQKDSGRTMAELFYENGISGIPADNRRVPGWLSVKEALQVKMNSFGEEEARLHIFKNCPVLISHLPALLRDEKNGSDASTNPHEITHICDALRYFILSYGERREDHPAMMKHQNDFFKKARMRANDSKRRMRF